MLIWWAFLDCVYFSGSTFVAIKHFYGSRVLFLSFSFVFLCWPLLPHLGIFQIQVDSCAQLCVRMEKPKQQHVQNKTYGLESVSPFHISFDYSRISCGFHISLSPNKRKYRIILGNSKSTTLKKTSIYWIGGIESIQTQMCINEERAYCTF